MRHLKKKKIGKGYDKDRRLMKSMASSLILYEKIRLSEKRAKLVRSLVEKMITTAKTNDLHSKRQLIAQLSINAARKAYEILGKKYETRAGGYTRITRAGKAKDGTPQVIVELI